MAEPLSATLSKRASIAAQVAALNAELESLDRDIFSRVGRLVEAYEGIPVANIQHPTSANAERVFANAAKRPVPTQPLIKTDQRTASRQEITAATVEILRANGAPMKLQPLLDELIKKGVLVGGKRPSGNLSAHLGLSGQFETGRAGWWFRGQPYPTTNNNAPEGASLI